MWLIVLVPFFLQAIAMIADEGYFHVRRGLPQWERLGHPLDTLSYLICLLFVLWTPFDAAAVKIYCGLSLFSCLMVTKDEFIHKHHCPWAENWLHAVLFILHPIVLICVGLIWPVIHNTNALSWLDHPLVLERFLWMQVIVVSLFFLYQVIFWNIVWRNAPVTKQ